MSKELGNIIRTVSNPFPDLVEALRPITVIIMYNIKRGNPNGRVLVIYSAPGGNGLPYIHTPQVNGKKCMIKV